MVKLLKKPGFVPWLIVIAIFSAGLWRIETNGRDADRRICEATDDNRKVLRDLIDQYKTVPTTPLTAIQDPELRNLLKQSREASEEIQDKAAKLLTPPPCADVSK